MCNTQHDSSTQGRNQGSYCPIRHHHLLLHVHIKLLRTFNQTQNLRPESGVHPNTADLKRSQIIFNQTLKWIYTSFVIYVPKDGHDCVCTVELRSNQGRLSAIYRRYHHLLSVLAVRCHGVRYLLCYPVLLYFTLWAWTFGQEEDPPGGILPGLPIPTACTADLGLQTVMASPGGTHAGAAPAWWRHSSIRGASRTIQNIQDRHLLVRRFDRTPPGPRASIHIHQWRSHPPVDHAFIMLHHIVTSCTRATLQGHAG